MQRAATWRGCCPYMSARLAALGEGMPRTCRPLLWAAARPSSRWQRHDGGIAPGPSVPLSLCPCPFRVLALPNRTCWCASAAGALWPRPSRSASRARRRPRHRVRPRAAPPLGSLPQRARRASTALLCNPRRAQPSPEGPPYPTCPPRTHHQRPRPQPAYPPGPVPREPLRPMPSARVFSAAHCAARPPIPTPALPPTRPPCVSRGWQLVPPATCASAHPPTCCPAHPPAWPSRPQAPARCPPAGRSWPWGGWWAA
jgi:hypothetical protein